MSNNTQQLHLRRIGIIQKHLIPLECEKGMKIKAKGCSSNEKNWEYIENLPLREDTREILEKERNNASFDVDNLISFLDGGEENTNIKSMVSARLDMDPILKDEVKTNTFFFYFSFFFFF